MPTPSYFFFLLPKPTLPEAATASVLLKKDILERFAKFVGEHLFRSLFFDKVVGLTPAILLKKRLLRRFFLVNFAKFARISFLQNNTGCFLDKDVMALT